MGGLLLRVVGSVRHVPSYQVYQGGPGQAEQETLTCKGQAGIFFLADLKRILERYGNRAATGPSR